MVEFGIVCAIAGIAIGAWVTYVFLTPEKEEEYQSEKPNDKDVLDLAADLLLGALPHRYILLGRDNLAERSSLRARSFGIVSENKHVNESVIALAERTRADGLVHIEDITLARHLASQSQNLHLTFRAAPLSHGRVLLLFEDNDKISRLEKTRRDFTANVSHELKTPIGALELLLETIEENANEKETVTYFAAKARREVARLATLVSDLIELNRVQALDPLATGELVDIDEVVDKAIANVSVEAASHNIRLVTSAKSREKIFGDEKMITSALTNIIENAVHYSPDSTTVTIAPTREEKTVRIVVIDQGEGIPHEARERIFERFYRVDKARSREKGGSGLGLSIVKHVVEEHGGKIDVWSRPGHGSTFTLIFPRAADISDEAYIEVPPRK